MYKEDHLSSMENRPEAEPIEQDEDVFSVRYSEMTDEEIVQLCHNGDSLSEEYLLNKYKNFVRSKARSYFLIGADHEDIVQEGMIGLYKAIRDFKQEKLSSFRAFAELCITRQIITAIKTATRQKHIPLNSYVSLNKPLYDEENGALRAGIRYWQVDETKPLRLTLYEEDGFTEYIKRKDDREAIRMLFTITAFAHYVVRIKNSIKPTSFKIVLYRKSSIGIGNTIHAFGKSSISVIGTSRPSSTAH